MRPEPAAAGPEMETELNGWLSSAPCCWFGFRPRRHTGMKATTRPTTQINRSHRTPTKARRTMASVRCQFISLSGTALTHSGCTRRCGQYCRMTSASLAPVELRYEAKPRGLSAHKQTATPDRIVAAATSVILTVRVIPLPNCRPHWRGGNDVWNVNWRSSPRPSAGRWFGTSMPIIIVSVMDFINIWAVIYPRTPGSPGNGRHDHICLDPTSRGQGTLRPVHMTARVGIVSVGSCRLLDSRFPVSGKAADVCDPKPPDGLWGLVPRFPRSTNDVNLHQTKARGRLMRTTR